MAAMFAGAATVGGARDAHAFAYIFAGGSAAVDTVTHPTGYNGTGGNIVVTVGIDPTSSFAAQMVIPTQNAVSTWNGLLPTTGNIDPHGIGSTQADFELVVLHEMGHALGLNHPNLASESGLSGSSQNYTKSTPGPNGTYDLNAGPDGIIGSADDIRGDDVNLNYFRKSDNNPFATNLGTVNSTTYSRNIADLPAGSTYSANADRAVGAALGFVNTEAVMQQGTFLGETQRTLGADDVAGILYAEAGLDGIAGTADDYTVTLDFLGLASSADILIGFNNSQTSFAQTDSTGSFIDGTSNQAAIGSSNIYFNTNYNWYFNQTSNAVDAPATLALLGFGFAVFVRQRRRRAA